ncbi:LysR family transcriptional regulator, partial [Vibrio fluvialis]|nr:LysR family transcriptional regulator [Vibrio fluvialis]
RARQRITVDNFEHAYRAVEQGVGFCRLPKHIVGFRPNDRITMLDIEHSNQYQIALHLTLPKGIKSGPAALALYQILLDSASHRL